MPRKAEDVEELFKFRSRRLPEEESFRSAVLSSVRRGGVRAVARPGAARARVAVRLPRALDRRAIVKARIVGGGDAAAPASKLHLAYVEREGVEMDGSPGRLYGHDGKERATQEAALAEPGFQTDGQKVRGELLAPLPGEQHQFRLIVSPEDAGELDLTAYTREYMRRVERDLGQPLIWGAVNHYDTDNPHVHVIVRGVDRNGAAVRMDRAYVSHGLRRRAQELATEELGPRSELERDRQLSREVNQQRLTSLDRAIGRRETEGVVRAEGLTPVQRERMRVLERMQLAAVHVDVKSRFSWRMAPNWQTRLREDGERGDIIKQMHRALRGDQGRYIALDRRRALPVHPLESPGELNARVASIGLSDKRPDGYYAILETPSGGGYFLPLWPREALSLRTGDLVAVRGRAQPRSTALDREIDELANSHAERQVIAATPTHAKRLEQLVRLGLASLRGENSYTVSANFREELARLDRETPRMDIRVTKSRSSLETQVQELSETWLDRVPVCGASAFGQAVERYKKERQSFLAERGIAATTKFLPRSRRGSGEARDAEPELLHARVVSIHAAEKAVAVLGTAVGEKRAIKITDREASLLEVGQFVRLRASRWPLQKAMDAEIAARASDGRVRADDRTRPRLEELGRLGLAKRHKDKDTWTVEPAFPERLAERDRQRPRRHLAIEVVRQPIDKQVYYYGPTWLDGVTADAAPPDVRSAKIARDRFLEARSIPAGPGRMAALRELERAEVLGRECTRLGLSRAERASQYEGTFERLQRCPSGETYAVITTAKGVQVVRAEPHVRELVGQRVLYTEQTGFQLRSMERSPARER